MSARKLLPPKQKAQLGRDLIKEAVLEYLESLGKPATHAAIVSALQIPSDFEGGGTNYLSWAILGILVNEGKITYTGDRLGRVYCFRSY
jgi:hypothetical protein